MSDQKKFNVYDFPLHEVTTESIKLCEDERKKYNKNLEQVLDSVINQMKNDETFKCLYRTKGYAGSSYENLKIGKPNEFDINLIFVWPTDACQIIYDSKQPGYVKLKVNLENIMLKKLRDDSPMFDKQLKKWIDSSGFFMRMKFKSWMQGRVVKALEAVSVEGTEIKQSASGPAITLKIQQNPEKLKYSVDLVPTFSFTEKDWPKRPVRPLRSSIKCKEWSVVPKEPANENEPVYWRMTFYSQEKELLNDRGSVKHVIKLIKLLRDKENWSNDLYSYAIKTVFLWECENLDAVFWKKGVGFLFAHMLQKLAHVYLTNGKIPYYWDEKLNIIGKMKDSTRKIMKDRICVILKALNSSMEQPYKIKKYFGCVPEETLQNPSDSNMNSSLIDLELDDEPYSTVFPKSFAVSPSQNLLETEIKPEREKVNIDEHCTVEYNKCISDTKVDADSPSVIELCRTILKKQQENNETQRTILKKQQENNETLQSVLSQLSELCKEVKILRQENAQTKKEQLQGNTKELIFSTSPSTETIKGFLSSSDTSISQSSINENSHLDISQAFAIQQNSLTRSNECLRQVPKFERNKDNFSELLPDNFHKF